MKTLEILLSYQCNSRCAYCFLPAHRRSESMPPEQVAKKMYDARRRGAENVFFSGGEPTLDRNLFKYAGIAAKLGFKCVRVRTNGMMLSSPAYVDRLLRAGINSFCVSVKSADAATHDELSRVPGGFDLVVRGIENAVGSGAECECDLLVHALNYRRLKETVRFFIGLGLKTFNFQFISSYYSPAGEMSRLLVPMEEAGPLIGEACAEVESRPGSRARAYYVAPCFLKDYHRFYYNLAREKLVVADVNGTVFPLEETPMQGKIKIAACGRCVRGADCSGLREDYLEIYGDSAVEPLTEA